ncbi:MAG TPA: A/G-specific adenine glycosylase, partial [Chitinophagales bacterium]|nr:A/G-specific adenine glycosylase [Chitinophagales bacterium]
MKTPFTSLLITWNKQKNTRQMPWKGEKDPYLIWLSEIILQQTRVEQGLPYFLRFKQKYPTVKHLALAPEDDVMKLWQGLGYYSRARNLHETAKNIYHNLGGEFPDRFDELVKLKGVGAYTAAAIASFAFGEPKAVVDGNVIRVLARVFGISTAFDTTAGKKEFAAVAQQLIDTKQPAAYNQAIMDF